MEAFPHMHNCCLVFRGDLSSIGDSIINAGCGRSIGPVKSNDELHEYILTTPHFSDTLKLWGSGFHDNTLI